jgi:hypothetical protein
MGITWELGLLQLTIFTIIKDKGSSGRALWYTPVIPVLGRLKQKIENLRPTWLIDPVSKKNDKNQSERKRVRR